MPQILVDYSADLDFDRDGFAKELHPLVTEVIDVAVRECKTVFRPAAQYLVGDGSEGRAVVLVEIKILAGRSAGARAELAARVMELVRRYVTVPAGLGVQVTELDRDIYRFAHHDGS
ncbi:5-carboxymethyl-2-hydroxymuconate Delta-isomerase [Yinghuangia seranimata]|uniref:5-carboxymethyl-2-hydroxymuconate Delta-isomerase n=1 Tax=Yinghuangia seranimata TaxID=408067 RepID=UPI00248CE6D0|nr:isomerase [Yinghuangia seranimata]MDI2129553.1 isomerase [Yinghuangia seranimata]